MISWTIEIDGASYVCADYGKNVGLTVERRGYTVLTGFFQGSQVAVDSTQLAGTTLARLLDAIAATHPGRRQKALFAGAAAPEAIYGPPPKKKAAPAPRAVQGSLFGGPIGSDADAQRMERRMEPRELDAGPLFRWAAR